MKYILKIILVLISVFTLIGCNSTDIGTKEDREKISNFSKFYVTPIKGGGVVFSSMVSRKSIDERVVNDIKSIMKDKGFTIVDNESQAEFIVIPYFVEYVNENQDYYDQDLRNSRILNNASETALNRYYANLEIHIKIVGQNSWACRGFSNIKVNARNATESTLLSQVKECLKGLPDKTNSLPSSQ